MCKQHENFCRNDYKKWPLHELGSEYDSNDITVRKQWAFFDQFQSPSLWFLFAEMQAEPKN